MFHVIAAFPLWEELYLWHLRTSEKAERVAKTVGIVFVANLTRVLMFYFYVLAIRLWLRHSEQSSPILDHHLFKTFGLFIPLIYVFIRLLYLFNYHMYLKHMIQKSVIYLKNTLGYIVSFFGKIRKGKDLTMTIIARIFARLMQGELFEKNRRIQVLIDTIDFRYVNHYIERIYHPRIDLLIFTYYMCLDLQMMDHIRGQAHVKGNETEYFEDLISEYIENHYKLYMRGNYIASNSPIVDIHGNLCKRNSYEDFQLKVTDDFRFEKDTVNCLTEINMAAPAYNYDTAKKREQNDDGVTELMVSFGQIFTERSRLFVTQQKVEKWAKPHREQVNDFVKVLGFEMIGSYQDERLQLKSMSQFLEQIQGFIGLFKRDYLLCPNVFRSLSKELLKLEEWLFYRSVLKIGLNIYHTEDKLTIDLRDPNSKVSDDIGEAHDLYVECLEGFGMFNTHFLEVIYHDRQKASTEFFEDLENYESMHMTRKEIIETGNKNLNEILDL